MHGSYPTQLSLFLPPLMCSLFPNGRLLKAKGFFTYYVHTCDWEGTTVALLSPYPPIQLSTVPTCNVALFGQRIKRDKRTLERALCFYISNRTRFSTCITQKFEPPLANVTCKPIFTGEIRKHVLFRIFCGQLNGCRLLASRRWYQIDVTWIPIRNNEGGKSKFD